MLSMPELIARKKRGLELGTDEINWFVNGVTDPENGLPDYQITAFLMAVCFRGMTARETADLTLAMAHSGDMLDLSALPGVPVDKHSTGGVGDTTTLVLVPLVAACGGYVAKMSGRGLGHTGGTLDKLESIPGFSVMLPPDAFIQQVQDIGCAVVGQSAHLAPADGRLYALRDVTATVDCVPLIASSILSKKLASGAQGIVLDVKTGSGALMSTLQQSITLARAMVDIGTHAGRHVTALVTGMHEPLGTHVGNALEVREAIDILAGRAGGPLRTLSIELGAHMLLAARVADTLSDAKARLERALDGGDGLERLARMIAAQGGDASVCGDLSRLPAAPIVRDVPAPRSGYAARMDTTALGETAQRMGAGRVRKTDAIDPAVGFVMRARVGDRLRAGQPLCTLHARTEDDFERAKASLYSAIEITDAAPETPRLIQAVVTADGTRIRE